MILVTGASGQLASRALEHLHARHVDALGASRQPTQGQRRLDFDDPTTVDFRGVTTLLFVSAGGAEDDQVIARHRTAVDAAARDGVRHVIYTSLTSGGEHLPHAVAHRRTEQLIRDSNLAWTFLRNGLYAELFGQLLARTPDGLESPFGDGALSAAARPDLAEAAALVAADPSAHVGRTYDLVGPTIRARDVAERLGVGLRDIDLGRYRAQVMADDRLRPYQRPMVVAMATNIRHGFMDNASDDLARLLGRAPSDSLAVAAEVAGAQRP